MIIRGFTSAFVVWKNLALSAKVMLSPEKDQEDDIGNYKKFYIRDLEFNLI